jgi:hypothetical protein
MGMTPPNQPERKQAADDLSTDGGVSPPYLAYQLPIFPGLLRKGCEMSNNGPPTAERNRRPAGQTRHQAKNQTSGVPVGHGEGPWGPGARTQ